MVSKLVINYIDHVFIFIPRSPCFQVPDQRSGKKIENSLGVIIFNNHKVGKEN